MNTITLTNSAVNSGNSMKVLSQNFNYVWGNLTKDYPIRGKKDIISVQATGWKNPVISMQCVLPLSNTPIGTMTWNQFMQLARNTTSTTYLNASTGTSDTVFSSYAHSSTGVTSIPVVITDFQLITSPDQDADKYYLTINMVETV